MVKINENYLLLQNSYLFVEVNRRAAKYMEENPDKNVIKMGIGDVTKPLTPTVIKAFKDAVDEMAEADTFMGYGPEQGYDFLRVAVQNYYAKRNVNLELEEIFISDGAKSDLGNILDLFDKNNAEDLKLVEKWKLKNTKYYNNAIATWTIRDIEKYTTAKENNLNYLVFYFEKDFNNWIKC